MGENVLNVAEIMVLLFRCCQARLFKGILNPPGEENRLHAVCHAVRGGDLCPRLNFLFHPLRLLHRAGLPGR